MLASVVVVPDDQPRESVPSLKRRQSSISSDTSKRPRLDTNVSQQSNHGSPPQSATGMSPPPSRRRSSALGTDAVEEKKRGQRLFGGLLGTLSQTSAKPAHRKRDEIEKRQQEKIRQKEEELAEEKRKKREQIDALRRKEQKLWDEQTMRIRHQNLRATSHFLKTKTKPPLYFKPWELRPEEEQRIKRQLEDAENLVNRELAEHAAKKGAESGINEVHTPVSDACRHSTKKDKQKPEIPEENEAESRPELVGADDTNMQGTTPPRDYGTTDAPVAPHDQSDTKEVVRKSEEKPPNDDHGGEELVEGQEDDVIY